jgi:hypothetical protein
MKAVQACYWIVGRDNTSQTRDVAVDLHDSDGAVVMRWSRPFNQWEDAAQVARAYASSQGVYSLTYDDDSTQAFADC